MYDAASGSRHGIFSPRMYYHFLVWLILDEPRNLVLLVVITDVYLTSESKYDRNER